VPGEFFIDTSAWFPLLAADHPRHVEFVALARRLTTLRLRPVTTNLVAAETHALLLSRKGRRRALTGYGALLRGVDVVVHSTPELEAAARRDWLERYDDQDFSLADAVSVAVMRARRIDEVLTLDRHFAAAGFRALPQEG
jgi:predicted nucleic acid-binding protein